MSSSTGTSPAPESTDASPSPPAPESNDASPSPPAQSPPPSDSGSSPSPPPPSSDSSTTPASSPPPLSDDSSPPPPSDSTSDNSPPPPTDVSDSGSIISPPPPPSSASSPTLKALSPPPPPPAIKSAPTSSSTTPSSSSSSANLPLVVGITVGVGLLIIALLAICITCFCKKKKRRRGDMDYYMDSRKGSNYFPSSAQQPHPGWHGGSSDYVTNMHSSPGSAWPGPPPPPPMMSSGDMSSSLSGTHRHNPSSSALALGFNSGMFTYEELVTATGGFSQANLLGQGGFGYVHKGVLQNGKEVAVKSLKAGSGQGEREFQAEVEIISRVHHRHLVSLVGYCVSGGQRMLVYEFIPNKTLEHHLYGSGLAVMEWSTRLRIAIGSAKGLAYLHEDCHPKIIHRDIKTANILIDNNFEAMVADFGLAKLSSDNYTHVSTRIMGTFGYLAPEYAASGKLTEKSDVFSYGVMLLEIITGKRPVDLNNVMEDSLVDWARPLMANALADGNYDELVDPFLENNYNRNELARMVACASAATRHSAKKRPKMSQIVRALEGDVSLDDLNEGVKPGQSTVFLASGSLDYDADSYNTNMKKFKKVALSSQDFVSSDYGTSSGDSREIGRSPNKL